MEKREVKNEGFSIDDFQDFCDTLENNPATNCIFTLDYFDTCMGVSPGKEVPSILSFSVSLLHEILCNMKPGHELWDKVKYATFILYHTTRNVDEFNLLYDIFHQVEIEVQSKNLQWRDKQVQASFEEKIVEKFIVKEDIADLSTDICYDFVSMKQESESETKASLNAAFSMDPISTLDYDDDTLRDDYHELDLLEADQAEVKPKIKRKYTKRKKEADDENKEPKKRKTGKNSKVKGESKQTNGESKPQRTKRIMRPGILPCPSCDYKAKDNYDFDKHTFHKHEALCTQCGYLSTSFRDYTLHNQTHIHTCDICQAKKLGLRSFRRHMKTHENKEELSEDAKTERNRVTCDMCGLLMFQTNLKKHILTEHTNEIHKCDLCDYTANYKNKVQTHRRTHFMKLTKCDDCGKMVKNLKRHFQRNCANKERERLNCHLCDKSFSLKDGLTKHIKHVHQKIMNFHCDLCDYKTYSGFNLRLHVSKMHTKEDINKKMCPYCNLKTTGLDYHIKIYHIEEHLKNQVDKEEPVKQDVDE